MSTRTRRGLLLLGAWVSALSACYLFSDEPKARKQASDSTEPAGEPVAADTPEAASAEAPAESAGACPPLTGVLSEDRSLSQATGCEQVTVQGRVQVEGATLTIEAGVELRFEADAGLELGVGAPGVLAVHGSAAAPVRMTGVEGRWRGLTLGPQSAGSRVDHLELVDAGDDSHAAVVLAGQDLGLTELTVSGALGPSLELVEGAKLSMRAVHVASPGAPVAILAAPGALGGVRELELAAGAVVAVAGGRIAERVEWPVAPYRVDGVLRIEGEAKPDEAKPDEGEASGEVEESPVGAGRAQLRLQPNTSLAFAPRARVEIGALGPGALVAAAAPEDGALHFEPAPGSATWAGVVVHEHGRLALRGAELRQGSERGEGMIVAQGAAQLNLEDCNLHDAEVGVELRGNAVFVERFTGNHFRGVPTALILSPQALGFIGELNEYGPPTTEPDEAAGAEAELGGERARIVVTRGKIERDTTWTFQAATLELRGDVFVGKGATLTVDGGWQVLAAKGITLGVGFYDTGSLHLARESDPSAPVRIGPSTAGQGWTGLVFGPHARDSDVENLRLSGTQGVAGVELRGEAEAFLTRVECRDCAGATATWACESQVGTIALTAAGSTPTATIAPRDCR